MFIHVGDESFAHRIMTVTVSWQRNGDKILIFPPCRPRENFTFLLEKFGRFKVFATFEIQPLPDMKMGAGGDLNSSKTENFDTGRLFVSTLSLCRW